NPFDVRLREIGLHHGLERLRRRRGGGDALHRCHAFTAGTVGGLGEHRLARREVRVEAAVCQAGVLHDVGDARAVVATAPDGTRGGLDDAVMRSFLGPGGGSLHMMCFILHSGRPSSRRTARGTAANASLISTRSTSRRFQPARSSACRTAGTGPMPNKPGSTAATP